MAKLGVTYRPASALIPYARNSREHSEAQVAQIAASIREFGFTNPVLIDPEGGIIAGHGRVLAAQRLGLQEVPTIELGHLTPTQRRAYVLADNQIALNAGWNAELLTLELGELKLEGFDLDLLGFGDKDLVFYLAGEKERDRASGVLAEKFLVPPLSVLNARDGWWQERKRAWISLGIRSELGRDAAVGKSKMVSHYERGQRQTGMVNEADTSVFDPVLCELITRWFAPPGGVILDPFAGGSVRGVVASKLGRRYVGQELRAEQVEANEQQGESICADAEHPPRWIAGDSRTIDRTCKDVHADLIFSCPPYADLERYSDDPADLSTLAYPAFREAYFEIIEKACSRLRKDRFACFVVGEVRDARGAYYDFVGDTVQAFRDAGLSFYNEAILVTQVGSTAMRAAKSFSASRKLGKTHQNVLVFCKGDGKRATQACGEIEIAEEAFAQAEEEQAAAAASGDPALEFGRLL